MTKIYEEAIRGDLDQILKKIKSRKIKGEVVLIIEGSKGELIKEYTPEEIEKQFIKLISQGISKKNALKIMKSRYDIDRQKLYNISTKI